MYRIKYLIKTQIGLCFGFGFGSRPKTPTQDLSFIWVLCLVQVSKAKNIDWKKARFFFTHF